MEKSNAHLFYNYNVISFFLDQFGLIIKHGKTEIFYFSKLHSIFNSPPTSVNLKALFLNPKIYGNILVLFLIENFCSDNTLNFTWTKHCQLSRVWKYLAILYEAYFFSKNIFYIKPVYYPLSCIAFFYGIITMHC